MAAKPEPKNLELMMNTISESRNEFGAKSTTQRPRYYARQLITPGDMTLEQDYFRDKMRRHNRLLHGWGVVCGAQVCPVPSANGTDFEPWKVVVHAGYALGPMGDEILIGRERTVDLRTEGVSDICGSAAGESQDPWCSDVFVRRDPYGKQELTLYVAVKYKEVLDRPVRVHPSGCGCGCSGAQCEFSRVCDGYEIGILDECPESHASPPLGDEPDLNGLVRGAMPDCLDCQTNPWVVLAKVVVGTDGSIEAIDNCECRRIVVSFARAWWRCSVGAAPAIESIAPSSLERGSTTEIVVIGSNLAPKGPRMVSLGAGVHIVGPLKLESSSDGATTLTVSVAVDEDARPGGRTLKVANSECDLVISVDAITITGEAEEVVPDGTDKPVKERRSGSRRPKR
jgi:hypothetical protein